jgi:hypothetical protein
MTRPTTTHTLPISGYTVEIATYLTKREDDAVNACGMAGAEIVNEPDPETGEDRVYIRKMPVDRYRREVGKLLEVGIKAARVEGQDVPVTADFVADLPQKDADFLAEKLIAVRAGNADPKVPSPTDGI